MEEEEQPARGQASQAGREAGNSPWRRIVCISAVAVAVVAVLLGLQTGSLTGRSWVNVVQAIQNILRDLRGNESTQAKRQQWQDVEAGRHSYLAALLSDEGEFVCGATYLRPGFLVSTHHCIMQIGPNPKVALGFTGIDEKGNVMATQICHAEYNIEHPEHPAKGNTDPTLGVDTVLLKLPSWVGLVKEEPPMTAHPTHDIYIAQSLIGFRLAPPHPHTRRRAIQAARFQIANTLMQQGSAEFLWVHTECVPGPDTSLSDPVHRGFPQFDLIAVEVIFSTYYFGVDATGAVRVMKMVEWINEERLPLAAVLCMLLLVVITGMATMWSIISCRLMHAAQHQHQSHGNIIKDLHSIIDLASQQWRHVRYNRGILHFLSKQMECLKALTDLPRDIPMETWIKMKRDLESGENLIRRHACPFDLQRFYAIDEAKSAVETICVKLQDSVHLLDTSMAMGIAHVVPDANICADRSLLESRLRFVLFDEQVMWTDMEIEEEWYEVRRRHKESLAKVTMIADEEIDLDSGAQEIGMGGEGCVWRVQWGGKMVAAKHVSQKGRSPKIERLARAFTEAALSASLLHDHITRLLAMTKSGCTMVMELAEGNLVTWYRHNIKASCWSRIKLMHQAARGLAHVHRQPEELVHCDVKSANFLVFEDGLDGDPVVKLCDFGIATTQQPDLTTTLRQQPRTTLYCAPEIYVQKHHTQKSDVFSFGVVMCELAAQRSPYMEAEGLNHAVMRMKNDEELPCPIPDDCHKGLKPLIEQCLKCDSGERPSMDDVMEKLEKILQDCVPELQTPASSAARDVGV